jgi:hypothetical protein
MSIQPPADEELLRRARAKLGAPRPRDRHWAALAAAAFFAACAIGFAVASVLAPPVNRDPAARTGVR